MSPDEAADLGEHPDLPEAEDLDPAVLDRGVELYRMVYPLDLLRRAPDHLALHTIPVGGQAAMHHVVVSTTLTSDRLALALEQLADLVREGAT